MPFLFFKGLPMKGIKNSASSSRVQVYGVIHVKDDSENADTFDARFKGIR